MHNHIKVVSGVTCEEQKENGAQEVEGESMCKENSQVVQVDQENDNNQEKSCEGVSI